jgi:hypothetical protein
MLQLLALAHVTIATTPCWFVTAGTIGALKPAQVTARVLLHQNIKNDQNDACHGLMPLASPAAAMTAQECTSGFNMP